MNLPVHLSSLFLIALTGDHLDSDRRRFRGLREGVQRSATVRESAERVHFFGWVLDFRMSNPQTHNFVVKASLVMAW